ncbi:MAG: rhodanese-like domain-containing protein [Kiritimatiellae bacterium]|nr:rhodanese-like domain-containing protein [Kiritimatiellia bacterium]
MTFEFFGNGKHKISPAMHLTSKNAVFLVVRSDQELKTLAFSLVHHMPVLHIPVDEIPDRLSDIPRDKIVGVFCSSGVRSTMVYFYLRTLGYDNVRIIEGGYAELVEEFKPGKLLKHLAKGNAEA